MNVVLGNRKVSWWMLNPPLLVLTILFCLHGTNTHAQGTIQYTANLSNPNSGAFGSGEFLLQGDAFTYHLFTIFGMTEAEIRGPGPAADAPVVLQLDFTTCLIFPDADPRTGCYFDGTVNLSPSQIDSLNSAEWYAWARSPSAPSTPISGQIVPEPSFFALSSFVLFVIGVLAFRRKLTKNENQRSICTNSTAVFR